MEMELSEATMESEEAAMVFMEIAITLMGMATKLEFGDLCTNYTISIT